MKYATIKIEPIIVAGGEVSLTPNDFNFFDGATQVYPTINSITITGSSRCTVSVNSTNLTVLAWKHYNSTSPEDDVANGHPNTYEDDVKVGLLSFAGTMTDGTDTYDILVRGRYYAAIHPPAISFTRLRDVLGVSTTALGGLSTSDNINIYSPDRPNKTAPHGVSEFIGYSHVIQGNASIYSLTRDRALIRKMPVVDSDTNLSNFKLRYYKNGSSSAAYTHTVNLSSVEQVSVTQNLDGTAGATDNWEVKLYRTTNASVEHLIDSTTIEVYTPLPNITGLTASSPDYAKGSVPTITLSFTSAVTMTATVYVAYFYMIDSTGQTFRVPTTGFNAVGSPTFYNVVIGSNTINVSANLTVPNPSTQTILSVVGELRNSSSSEKYSFTVPLPDNAPVI